MQDSVVTLADCQGHDKDFTLAVRCFCGLSRSRFSIAHDSYRMSFRTTVYETQCCSRDIEDGQWGQMGGSPKALATASGRGNQPPPESNRGCPGPRNIRNELSFWISSRRRLPPCQWETSQQNSTGSSMNLERSTMDLSIDHFAKAQACRGAFMRCYFRRQLEILNLCGTGTGCRVCRAERSICWTSHFKRPLCTFSCDRNLGFGLHHGSLFFVAPGRQDQNEAHSNFLCGDNDGFATSPAL